MTKQQQQIMEANLEAARLGFPDVLPDSRAEDLEQRGGRWRVVIRGKPDRRGRYKYVVATTADVYQPDAEWEFGPVKWWAVGYHDQAVIMPRLGTGG